MSESRGPSTPLKGRLGREALAIALLANLASCGERTREIEAVKAAVKAQLRDPGSAEFTNIRVVDDGAAVCGEVNARNGFGGYSGRQRFWGTPDGQTFLVKEGDEIGTYCDLQDKSAKVSAELFKAGNKMR